MSKFIEDFPPQPLLEQLWILSPGDDTGMVQFFDRLPGTICASVVIDVNIIPHLIASERQTSITSASFLHRTMQCILKSLILPRRSSRFSWLHFRRGEIEFHILNFGDAPAINTPAARGLTHVIKPIPCRPLIIRCPLPASGNLVKNRHRKERRGSYWSQCVSPKPLVLGARKPGGPSVNG